MKFRTKIDIWVFILIAVIIAAIIYSVINLCDPNNPDISKDIIPIVILTPLMFVVLLPMCFDTYYVLEDDYLYVKSWFFYKTKIQYQEITTIRLHVSLWAAPVLSIFRIEISYGRGGGVLITPRNQKEFLKLLNEKIERSKNDDNPSIDF
ncbi:MAG TPA: PH domain-containing protein [Clostridia bacterium]|nr:PH domain-containing protein [Clostridia bacterium]